jgi:hypothetical protein
MNKILIREESKNSKSIHKQKIKKKEIKLGEKIHDNTDIDYFYNSGIDYLSKSFLEIEKEFETFPFSSGMPKSSYLRFHFHEILIKFNENSI